MWSLLILWLATTNKSAWETLVSQISEPCRDGLVFLVKYHNIKCLLIQG